MLKHFLQKYFLFLTLGLIFCFWFLLTKDNFFHWDEWSLLPLFNQPLGKLLLQPFDEHYVPITFINHYTFFKLFGLTYWPFQLSVTLLHTIGSFILFKIVKRETNSSKLAFMAMVLFAFSSVDAEQLSWSWGFQIVFASTAAFASYWFSKKNIFLSCFFLIISPFGHGITVLLPWAFAFKAILEKKRTLPYVLVGVFNLALLYWFSRQNIGTAFTTELYRHYFEIPAFIVGGFVKGTIFRFFLPSLYFFPKSASQFGHLIRPFLIPGLIGSLGVGLILVLKSEKKSQIFHLVLKLFPFLILGYVAAAPTRVSGGIDSAAAPRYAYLSLFFLLILLANLVKILQVKISLVIPIVIGLFVLHFIAIQNFNFKFWKIMVGRDRQFISDVKYLFDHNDKVYDLTMKGINGKYPISKYWFLFPADHKISFIPASRFTSDLDLIEADQKSKEIYRKFATEYQMKYD